MPDDTQRKAEDLIARLKEHGQHDAAESLHHAVLQPLGVGMLRALREALQVALTAVEAIDPATETMVEELRLEVDKDLLQRTGTDQPDPKGAA
jgi:hypothetical protein